MTKQEADIRGKISELERVALSSDYKRRICAIKDLGNLRCYEAAVSLLRIAKEWSHQKELSDDPTRAIGELGTKLALEQMMKAHSRPGPSLSPDEAVRIGRRSMSDAAARINSHPTAKVEAPPTGAIAVALTSVGEPALEAMNSWLAIKVHPTIGYIIVRAAEKIGGERAVSVLKRLQAGFADNDIKAAASRAIRRLSSAQS